MHILDSQFVDVRHNRHALECDFIGSVAKCMC